MRPPDIHNKYGESKLLVFPNPAENTITVTSKSGLEIAEIVIYNQIGQKVMHQKPVTQSIDVSILRKGMYIVEVAFGNKKARRKLFIK